MPYSVENPPAKLKNLSSKKKRQWVHVFISCWKQHHDDGTCHAMAWGVVKKSASGVTNMVELEERIRKALI